jgi:sugar (pentulose or hexulose) kinase
MLAGVACGVYPDLGAAVRETVRLDEPLVPEPQSSAAYASRFEIYKQLYPTLQRLRDPAKEKAGPK